jgi:hypothetical protein
MTLQKVLATSRHRSANTLSLVPFECPLLTLWLCTSCGAVLLCGCHSSWTCSIALIEFNFAPAAHRPSVLAVYITHRTLEIFR